MLRRSGTERHLKGNGRHYAEKEKKKRKLVLFLTIIIILLLLIISFGVYWFIYRKDNSDKSIFKNVPVDKYTERFESSTGNQESSGVTKSSFEFIDQIVFENGQANFSLKNPGDASQAIIVKIQISDEEMISKNGSTGRTEEQQKEIEKNPDYDPSSYRVLVSESGLVPSGCYLKKMDLKTLPNGKSLNKGTYSGIAFLEFVKEDTGEKSFVNTQLPIKIEVK